MSGGGQARHGELLGSQPSGGAQAIRAAGEDLEKAQGRGDMGAARAEKIEYLADEDEK